VYVQADSVKGSIDINDLLTGKIDSLVHTSSSTKLQLKFWYDKYTRLLHYRADLKTDTVIQIKDRIVEVKGDCPDTVVLDKDKGRTGIGKVIRVLWENLEAVLLLALLVFFIVGMMYYKYKTRVRS
jgi:hypothetical protein